MITTLAVDKSQSNVNVTKKKNNREVVQNICKDIVQQQKSIDILTIREFDSDSYTLETGKLTDASNVKRTKFVDNVCIKLATEYSQDALRGTDIKPSWKEFFKAYQLRKENNKINSNQSIESIDVYIFFVDALEDVPIAESSKQKISELETFKSSIKEFIQDGNFILIFVVDKMDREKLAKSLADTINLQFDQESRLNIIDIDDYKSKIENIYKIARKKK